MSDPIRLHLKLIKATTAKPSKETIAPVVSLTFTGEWSPPFDELPRLTDREFTVDLTLEGLAHLVSSRITNGWKQPGLTVNDSDGGEP